MQNHLQRRVGGVLGFMPSSGNRGIRLLLRHRYWCLPISLTFIPPAVIVYYISIFNVNILFLDEWDIIWSYLPDYDKNKMSFWDLIKRHNEHIIFTTKVSEFLYMILGATHRAFAYGVLFLSNLAVFLVLVWQSGKTHQWLRIRNNYWIWLLFSVLVFSVISWENWAGGVQTQFFYTNLFAIASIVLLANEFSWWKFGVAAFCSLLATVSFSNGITSWGVGLFVLFCRPHPLRQKALLLGGWSLISLITVGSIFLFNPIPKLPYGDILDFLQAPVLYVRYVIASLGTAFIYGNVKVSQVFTGMAGLVYLALLTRIVRKSEWELERLKVYLPWVAIGLYSVLSLAVVGIGRIDFGLNQAMAGRYSTFSFPFWISLIMLFYLNVKAGGLHLRHLKVISVLLILTMSTAYFYSTIRHREAWKYRGQYLRDAVVALRYGRTSAEIMKFITPVPAHEIDRRMKLLIKYDYSFAEPYKGLADYRVIHDKNLVVGHIDYIQRLDPTTFRLHGWAVDPTENLPAKEVFLVFQGRVIGTGAVQVKREDVVQSSGQSDFLYAGWGITLDAKQLPHFPLPEHELQVFAVMRNGKHVARLTPSVRHPNALIIYGANAAQ